MKFSVYYVACLQVKQRSQARECVSRNGGDLVGVQTPTESAQKSERLVGDSSCFACLQLCQRSQACECRGGNSAQPVVVQLPTDGVANE